MRKEHIKLLRLGLDTKQITLGQLFGCMIDAGAEIHNLDIIDTDQWDPIIYSPEGRLVVVPDRSLSTRYGAEELLIGLERPIKITGIPQLQTKNMVLVIYPRASDNGEIDCTRSIGLLMTNNQAGRLRKLILERL